MATCNWVFSSDKRACPLSCREDVFFCRADPAPGVTAHDANDAASVQADKDARMYSPMDPGYGVEGWPVNDYYGDLEGMHGYQFGGGEKEELYPAAIMLGTIEPQTLDLTKYRTEEQMYRNEPALRLVFQKYLNATGWNPMRSRPRCPSACPVAHNSAFDVTVTPHAKWDPILGVHAKLGFYIRVKVCLHCKRRRAAITRVGVDEPVAEGPTTPTDRTSYVEIGVVRGECPGEGAIVIAVVLCGFHGTDKAAAKDTAQLALNDMFGPGNETQPVCDAGCIPYWVNPDGSTTAYDGKTPPKAGEPTPTDIGYCCVYTLAVDFICVKGHAVDEPEPPPPSTPEGTGGGRTRGGSGGGAAGQGNGVVYAAPRLMAALAGGSRRDASFPIWDSDLVSRIGSAGPD